MKIATYNVAHCWNIVSKEIEYSKTAEAIKKLNPDIIGLNEIRHLGDREGYDKQIPILSDLTDIPYGFFAKAINVEGGNTPYGNGILSKYPIVSAEVITIPDPAPRTGTSYYESRCILKAKLEGDITVLVTHFGLNPDEQENAVNTAVANLESKRCILMGDFNIPPDNPLLDRIREKMKDVTEGSNRNFLSFSSDNPEIKIDYIFVSPDIDVISCDIPDIVCSDHFPHTAEIDM